MVSRPCIKKSMAPRIMAVPTMLEVSMVTYLTQHRVNTEQMTAPPTTAT